MHTYIYIYIYILYTIYYVYTNRNTYVNNFFLHTGRSWHYVPVECFPLA